MSRKGKIRCSFPMEAPRNYEARPITMLLNPLRLDTIIIVYTRSNQVSPGKMAMTLPLVLPQRHLRGECQCRKDDPISREIWLDHFTRENLNQYLFVIRTFQLYIKFYNFIMFNNRKLYSCHTRMSIFHKQT